MENEIELNFKEITCKCGKKFYYLDFEELSIETCIQLLFRMIIRENGNLWREGCSWLSLKKSR